MRIVERIHSDEFEIVMLDSEPLSSSMKVSACLEEVKRI